MVQKFSIVSCDAGEGAVVARVLSRPEDADFTIAPDSTLDGMPIARYDRPITLGRHGSLELTLYRFFLRNPSDASRFTHGQTVEVRP